MAVCAGCRRRWRRETRRASLPGHAAADAARGAVVSAQPGGDRYRAGQRLPGRAATVRRVRPGGDPRSAHHLRGSPGRRHYRQRGYAGAYGRHTGREYLDRGRSARRRLRAATAGGRGHGAGCGEGQGAEHGIRRGRRAGRSGPWDDARATPGERTHGQGGGCGAQRAEGRHPAPVAGSRLRGSAEHGRRGPRFAHA